MGKNAIIDPETGPSRRNFLTKLWFVLGFIALAELSQEGGFIKELHQIAVTERTFSRKICLWRNAYNNLM